MRNEQQKNIGKLMADLDNNGSKQNIRNMRKGLDDGYNKTYEILTTQTNDTNPESQPEVEEHYYGHEKKLEPLMADELRTFKEQHNNKYRAGRMAGVIKGLIELQQYNPAIKLLRQSNLYENKSMTQNLKSSLQNAIKEDKISTNELSFVKRNIEEYLVN